MARRRSTDLKRSRIDNWDDQRDEILLEVLKKQQSLGKGVGGHFPQDLWPTIVQAFNRKTGYSLRPDNLKNRLKVLKRTFDLYQSIVRKNGWEWDDDQNIPNPESPSKWNEIIAANPIYAKCKGKPFPRYRAMEFLCGGKCIMIGADDSRHKLNSIEPLKNAQPMPQPAENSPNPTQQDPDASSEEQPSSFSSEQRINGVTSSRRKRLDYASPTPAKVADIDQEQAEICREKSDQVITSKTKAHSIEDCMKKLEKVEGISPDAFVAACEGFKDPDNRTIFMNLDGLYLAAWIERQMKIDQQVMTQVRQQLVAAFAVPSQHRS